MNQSCEIVQNAIRGDSESLSQVIATVTSMLWQKQYSLCIVDSAVLPEDIKSEIALETMDVIQNTPETAVYGSLAAFASSIASIVALRVLRKVQREFHCVSFPPKVTKMVAVARRIEAKAMQALQLEEIPVHLVDNYLLDTIGIPHPRPRSWKNIRDAMSMCRGHTLHSDYILSHYTIPSEVKEDNRRTVERALHLAILKHPTLERVPSRRAMRLLLVVGIAGAPCSLQDICNMTGVQNVSTVRRDIKSAFRQILLESKIATRPNI